MPPLFLGSHPALDFLNTTLSPQGVPIELIGDGSAFLKWLAAARLLEADHAAALRRRFGAKAVDAVAAQARDLREWAREWLLRWQQEPRARWPRELEVLNGVLARGPSCREVAAAGDGLALRERRRFDAPEELLALLAAQIAALVTAEQAALVKRCTGPACSLWFLDRTKAHRRLFCSTTACGNRAKVAAFRERRRSG